MKTPKPEQTAPAPTQPGDPKTDPVVGEGQGPLPDLPDDDAAFLRRKKNDLEKCLDAALLRMQSFPVMVGTEVKNANDASLTGKQLAGMIRIIRQELQNLIPQPKPRSQS